MNKTSFFSHDVKQYMQWKAKEILDFPISHWYEHHGEKEFPTDEKSLTKSYKKTLNEYQFVNC